MLQIFVDKFISKKHELVLKFHEQLKIIPFNGNPMCWDKFFLTLSRTLGFWHKPIVIGENACEGILLVIFQDTRPFEIDPYEFYYSSINYGSCSHCDTLQNIQKNHDPDNEKIIEQELSDFMTLCLHLVQKMKVVEIDSNNDWDKVDTVQI